MNIDSSAAPTTVGTGVAIDVRPGAPVRVALLAAVGVVALVVNALTAVGARAAGASEAFGPLHPAAYVPLTVVGVLLSIGGWAVVRRAASRPGRVLRVLVPVLLVLSLVPDLTIAPGMEGANLLGVLALVHMHLTTAALLVLGLSRALPVR